MSLNPVAAAINNALFVSPLAQSIYYSRPAGPRLDAIDAFAVQSIINTSGPYVDPNGAIYGAVRVQSADIPLGPQKNDRIQIPDGILQAGTYVVQSVWADRKAGWSDLKIRWQGE